MRSIIEPTLGVRISSRRLPVVDATDGLRRERRFDCTSATMVGLVGRALSAAAAAAEERDASEERRMKAEAAAVAALALAVSLVNGCIGVARLRLPNMMDNGAAQEPWSS